MGKAVPDATIDAMFDYVDQCNIMHLCSGEPANYAGIAAVSLADVALTPDTDFTKANGDTSGRKVTIAAKSGVTVDNNGTATHVVIARTTDSTLRDVTTCTSQVVTAGNTVNFPAWKHEVLDPT
jgi:hypothetical protein